MCLDAYRLACRYHFLFIGGFLGVVRVVANGSGGHHDRSVVPERKDINCVKLNQVTVPASNIAASVEFYVRMGLELIVSSSHYARFVCPDGDSSFSVHLVPELVPWSGTVVYFEVLALDQKVRELQDRGMSFMQEPRDEPWLWREARLQDP